MQRLVAFFSGALLGVMLAFTQAGRTVVGGVMVPWGIVLSLVALVAFIRAAAWLTGGRLGAVMFFLGWLVTTLVGAMSGPGGDLVINSGARQVTYLCLGAVLGAAAAQWPVAPNDEQMVVGDTSGPGSGHGLEASGVEESGSDAKRNLSTPGRPDPDIGSTARE